MKFSLKVNTFLCLALCLWVAVTQAKKIHPDKLVAIVVVNRHGDRAPQNNAPSYAAGNRNSIQNNFPFDQGSWPVDYGQLTGIGMDQTRAFGSYLRDRYVLGTQGPEPGKWNTLLNHVYNHKETHARCTDVDRTLVTAMGIMSGLYPPGKGPLGQKDLAGKVEMVPIHTIKFSSDALMDSSSVAHCPNFVTASTNNLAADPVLKSATDKNTNLMKALPALTGKSPDEINALSPQSLFLLIAALRDLRICQKAHNVSVPQNISAFDDDFEAVTGRAIQVKWEGSGLGPVVGGRLLRSISVRFQTVIAYLEHEEWAEKKFVEECNAKGADSDEDGGCPRKLALYTGHDTTIFDLRAALGVPVLVEGIVPYVAHLIFELRKSDQGQFSVTVLAGHYNQSAQPISGPFCEGKVSCSIDTFVDYVNKTVPTNIDELCGLQPTQPAQNATEKKNHWGFFFTVLFSMLAGALIMLGAQTVLNGQNHRNKYRSID